MADSLYSVLSFTCALVLLIFMNQFRSVLDKSEKTDKDFLFLSSWVTIFCLQDGIWGVLASGAFPNNTLFFISSSVFHAAAAFSASERYFCSFLRHSCIEPLDFSLQQHILLTESRSVRGSDNIFSSRIRRGALFCRRAAYVL